MSSKKLVQKVTRMVTRSTAPGSVPTTEPETDLTLSHAQTSSSAVEIESPDRDIGVLGFKNPPNTLTKLRTLENRASNNLEQAFGDVGASTSTTEDSMYPKNALGSENIGQNSTEVASSAYLRNVSSANALGLSNLGRNSTGVASSTYQKNANIGVLANSDRQDDIESLSQRELELRIQALKESRRTNALRNELRALMAESPSHEVSDTVPENGGRRFESDDDRLRHKIVQNSKLFSQLKSISEPRLEIDLFETRCAAFNIISDRERLELLIHVWPRSDIIDFRETNGEEEFSYKNLKKYLINKTKILHKILRIKPSTLGKASFQSDRCLAEKLYKADKEDAIKYFLSVVCPRELKKK